MNIKVEGISVIIPVYNAEKYLYKCIKSVIQQGRCVAEIICVDDGSSDSSVNIIQKAKKMDKRIQLVLNSHSGVSRTRNIGMDKASAEYLMFMDADDYLISDTLQPLYKKACRKRADVLVFGGRTEDTFHSPDWVRRAFSPKRKDYFNHKTNGIFGNRGILPSACNKLYKREVLQNIRFIEQLEIAEDNVFQFMVFKKADRVVSVKQRAYVYRLHEASTLAEVSEEEKMKQHERAILYIYEYIQNEGKWQEWKNDYYDWKESLVYKEGVKKRGKLSSFVNYLCKFGCLAAFEYGIGKYMMKDKREG